MRERILTFGLLGLGLALLAFGLVPLVGKVLGANLGEGVVGQIRLATDLNPWVEKILLTLIGLAATAIFFKFNLTLSWNNQLIGSALIAGIWIATYGFLAIETSDPIEGPWFNTKGEPLRCYVLDTKGVRLLYLVERDPRTGQVCQPVTAELEPRLRGWLIAQRDGGGNLRLLPVAAPKQFFNYNGVPQVWFHARPDGTCEYFDLPGVHPDVGAVLEPISKDALVRCRNAEERTRKITDERAMRDAEAKRIKDESERNKEKMRVLEEEKVARYARYVGVPVQPGSAILATSDLGPLSNTALEVVRDLGHVVVLKPAFVSEGLFDSVWTGSNDLSTLGLGQTRGAVMLRPASQERITRTPGLEGFTSIQQAFSLLVVRPPYTVGTESANFTAEGLGFSADTARAQFQADFVAKLSSSLGDKLKRGR